jgi:hypothetical protein
MVCGKLAEHFTLLGDERAAEEELREALNATVELRPPSAATTVAELGLYAAFFAVTSGRVELAARLLGACQPRTNPAPLDGSPTPHQLVDVAVAERLSPERAEALRRSGASEDVFELLEEFLDRPAVADKMRPSASPS